ncbi:MAG TPA: hypothetical protein VH370_00415 [Humisphaera sp.]|jgi:uncharacterized membrane protein|nr:hypothetical protein [Humisphaera sp.]
MMDQHAKSRFAEIARRFVFVSTIAFWLGGFAFYTGVVVQVGAAVLHSHTRQGFITQRVTFWLNIVASIALLILLAHLISSALPNRRLRKILTILWMIMVILQGWLFYLHPHLDRLLDTTARMILDEERFELLHTTYVWSATAQWAVGVLYMFVMLGAWTKSDY